MRSFDWFFVLTLTILASALALMPTASEATEPPFVWHSGNDSLEFGIPETDARYLRANCMAGSSTIELDFLMELKGVETNDDIVLQVAAGKYRQGMTAKVAHYFGDGEYFYPVLTLSTDDSFWTAVIREQSLTLTTEASDPLSLSLKGSAAPVRAFLDACQTAQKS
ncbi:hypothetical protein [Coralliovum pocilloporae]|uniref:hypothetical protein n=1 Tax=Coralliovum pocilloporae TaxID=3066369 RepID=UPI0033078989